MSFSLPHLYARASGSGPVLRTLVVGLCVAALAVLGAAAAPARAADPVLAAAGDIACPPGTAPTAIHCQQAATASQIRAAAPDAVAALGDTQYDSGTYAEYMGMGAFDQTWGTFRSSIRPVPGNHEYNTTGASGYFTYFGSSAGDPAKGYYSYDLGAWHIVALNSACSGSACSGATAGKVSAAEVSWLQADLAAHPGVCTLAYWHHPLFTSGVLNGGSIASPGVKPLWDALYAAHADVALNGHAHNYERFVPQDPSGNAVSSGGLREFVVGTGGEDHLGASAKPNSTKLDTGDFGTLFLTLHPGGYDSQFKSTGGTVVDQSSGRCNRHTPAQVKTSVEAALQAATKALTRLRLHTLARAKSFRFPFTAPMAGTAVFKATARRNGKTITVASARLVFSRPGKTTVIQKLSRSAAVALHRLSAVSVVERIQFAPAHGSPFSARKRLTLKR